MSYCRFLSGVLRGELLQPYLVTNVTSLVEQSEPGSVCEKIELHLTYTCLLELLATDYLRYQFLYLIYGISSLDALRKSLKKKETKIKKEIIEALQQASYRRKRSG